MADDKKKSARSWVYSTYFAEGFPYSVVRLMTSIYFTDIGLKERYIGYLNFLGIPWNLKFLWAPFLDIFWKKRLWMIAIQAVITVLIAAVAFINVFAQSNPDLWLVVISLLFVVLAFFAATNDIAIDGYYMEGITDAREQARYAGDRVLAYRIAIILVRSGFVALAAWVATREGISSFHPWAVAFAAAAVTMLLTTLFHLWRLPDVETLKARTQLSIKEVFAQFGKAFLTYKDQERFLLVILFIIFYKVGDEILFSMSTPFLMRELLVTKVQLAWLGGIVGVFSTIIGTSVGGLWIKKKGLKRAIWPLTLLMNLNIWVYIWLAWTKPSAETLPGITTIAIVHSYEMIAAGLGNAVLLVFLLRTCKAEYKASHYAIGSAIMSLFSTFFGGFGGVFVESMGYLNFFILAFAATIPSMVILLKVPVRD